VRTPLIGAVAHGKVRDMTARRTETLTLTWTEQTPEATHAQLSNHGYAAHYSFTDGHDNPATPEAMVGAIPAKGYLIEISVRAEYFRR
jgi:hypothetical protein